MRRAHRSRARGGALSHWDLHYGPNMTPMVDVVMVILVFFMASTAVLGPEWFLRTALPVNKPKAASPEKPEDETRVDAALRVTSDGETVATVDGADTPLADFIATLAAMAQDKSPSSIAVLLRPDPGVPYQDLVRVHEACQALGIEKVGMIDATGK